MSRTTASTEPYLGPDDRDGYLLRTPYHEGFVAELKAQIPSRDRRWWDDMKAWWVSAEQQDLIHHLLVRFYGGYEVVDPDTGAVEYVGSDGRRTAQEGLFG